MPVEIERRFLVRDPNAAIGAHTASSSHITQGYFGQIDALRVHVRVLLREKNDYTALLTFNARHGYCRLEYEYPLDLVRAWHALDALPPMQIIGKRRYQVAHTDDLVWSIDQFEGSNQGLFVAEVELSHPNQKFALPPWAGEEITFNPPPQQLPAGALADAASHRWREGWTSSGLRQVESLYPNACGILPFEFLLSAGSEP